MCGIDMKYCFAPSLWKLFHFKNLITILLPSKFSFPQRFLKNLFLTMSSSYMKKI
jgi:hypothetical protein